MGNHLKMSHHRETNLKGKFQIVFNFEHTRFKVFLITKFGNFTITTTTRFEQSIILLGHFLAQKMQLFTLRRPLWPTPHTSFPCSIFQPTHFGNWELTLFADLWHQAAGLFSNVHDLTHFCEFILSFQNCLKNCFSFFLLELFNLLEIYCFGYTIIHRVLNVFVILFLGFLVHLLYRALALYF